MRTIIKDMYLPTNYDQLLYEQYHCCVQGNMSVHLCPYEFYRFQSRLDLVEHQSYHISTFLSGLRKELKNMVEMYPMSTLNDAVTLAQKVEKQIQNHPRYSSYQTQPTPPPISQNSGATSSFNSPSATYSDTKPSTSSTSQSNSQPFLPQTTNQESNPIRTNFKQTNHYLVKPSTNPNLKPMPIICYRCN